MPKRSSNPRGFNQLAAKVVHHATTDEGPEDSYNCKNLAAVELGRIGGLKGGNARAAKLTAEERSEAAWKAAVARWSRSRGVGEGV